MLSIIMDTYVLQDIDFLLYPSPANAEAIMEALTEFGFREAGIPKEYFQKVGSAIHLGVEPNRIDLLTHLKGVKNDQIFSNMKRIQLDGILVNIISFEDLIETKLNSDRLKDGADVEELQRIKSKELK